MMGFKACIWPAVTTSQLGHHQASCGICIAWPCSTHVDAFWSNSDQNGVTSANTIRILRTDRTPSIATSGWRARARSNCIEAPTPTRPIRTPKPISTAFTNPIEGISASDATASTTPAAANIVPAPFPGAGPMRALRTTLRKESGSGGEGGTWTYFLRPAQKITVATNIRMPGMPNAMLGPWFLRKMGIRSDAKNEPKFIVQ